LILHDQVFRPIQHLLLFLYIYIFT